MAASSSNERSSGLPSQAKSGAVSPADRRAGRRNALVLSAQVEDLAQGLKIPARSADVSVHGCYLDTLNPFVPNTQVKVYLQKGQQTFQSAGTVVYTQNSLGMGIAFRDTDPEQTEMLRRWLAEQKT